MTACMYELPNNKLELAYDYRMIVNAAIKKDNYSNTYEKINEKYLIFENTQVMLHSIHLNLPEKLNS